MNPIGWCTDTLNPIVGCSHYSPGCEHCYAEKMANRLVGMGQKQYRYVVGNDGRWNGETYWVAGVIERAVKMRKPRRIFWGSMTDLFHPVTPFEWIDRIMAAVALTPRHTHILLTKRAERMAEYMTSRSKSSKYWEAACPAGYAMRYKGISLVPFPLPNLIGMVTCCNQEEVDRNLPYLMQTPLAIRGVSLEPLLGPVDLTKIRIPSGIISGLWSAMQHHGVKAAWSRLHWVILGGETGPGARPMGLAWARKVRDDCQEAGVPFFYKGAIVDGQKNRLLDEMEWNELPESAR